MEKSENITAKLERIALDYRHDIEVAINRVNAKLENALTQLVEEFGYKAVDAAVDATADAIEDNLTIDYGPYPSLYEAFDCVRVPEYDEERKDA